MSYSIRCGDTGTDCPAEFTTRTQEELLEHVKVHAGSDHPEMRLDDQTVAKVKGLVRQA